MWCFGERVESRPVYWAVVCGALVSVLSLGQCIGQLCVVGMCGSLVSVLSLGQCIGQLCSSLVSALSLVQCKSVLFCLSPVYL